MSTRYDQAINHPARREERSNFPLGTKGDKVCGTVTSTDSEPGKFARDDGTYPQIPVVTLANVEFNGQPHEGDLVLKGYRAGLARLLNTCTVNDTLCPSVRGCRHPAAVERRHADRPRPGGAEGRRPGRRHSVRRLGRLDGHVGCTAHHLGAGPAPHGLAEPGSAWGGVRAELAVAAVAL